MFCFSTPQRFAVPSMCFTLAALLVIATCPAAHAVPIEPGGDGAIGTKVLAGTDVRFIEIRRSSFTNGEGTLHVGELEAFAAGESFVDPAVGNSGSPTNTNDFALSAAQGGNATFTTISGTGGHGPGANVISGLRNTGASTWTRAPSGGSVIGRIDLSQDELVKTLRVWQRADGCCQGRLAEFEVEAFEDDGSGGIGASKFFASMTGTVTPTNGAETFTLPDDSSFTLESGRVLSIEFEGSSQTSDLLQVGPAGGDMLTIESNVTLDLSLLDGFEQFTTGDTFQILDFGSVTGSFDTVIQPGGVLFDLTNLLVDGTVSVSFVAPEPSSAMLAGAGMLGLVSLRRRRRVAGQALRKDRF